jgi:hypothetical protein
MKQAGDMRYQRPAILRAFVDAYEDNNRLRCASIIGANPDIFLNGSEKELLKTLYYRAKAELGEACSPLGASE